MFYFLDENLAFKYANRGIIAPINVLWSQYLIDGKREKSDEIWNNYLQNSPRVMFQRILQKARENLDDTLVKQLIKNLKTSSVTQGALGNAYSCLLDIIVAKGNTDETISTFEEAIKDVKVDYINRTALLRIKEIYEKYEKPFNYTISTKNIQTNISNSDDEGQISKTNL